MEKVKLSEKEQKMYDYIVANVVEGSIFFKVIVDVFGEKAMGILGKLKKLGLIDITKNFRVQSAYGTRFPKQIVLKKPTEPKLTAPDIRILGEGQAE